MRIRLIEKIRLSLPATSHAGADSDLLSFVGEHDRALRASEGAALLLVLDGDAQERALPALLTMITTMTWSFQRNSTFDTRKSKTYPINLVRGSKKR